MKDLPFLDVQKDLERCEKHLKDTNTKGTEIEWYLMHFLLVRIGGKFEKEIERIIVNRAKKSGDSELGQYIENNFEPQKHLWVGDLRGKILKKFNQRIADKFDEQIKDKNPAIRYDNIVRNRHCAAHGGHLTMTFDELKKTFPDAIKLLDTFENVLK